MTPTMSRIDIVRTTADEVPPKTRATRNEPADEEHGGDEQVDDARGGAGRHPGDRQLDGDPLAGHHVVARVAAVSGPRAHGRSIEWRRGPGCVRRRTQPVLGASGGAGPATSPDRRRGRRAARPLPAGVHRPVGGPFGDPGPVGGGLPVDAADPRPGRHGRPTRTSTWSDLLGFFTRTFPAALYRTRWWWVTTALASVLVIVAHRGLDRCGTPRSTRASSRRPRSTPTSAPTSSTTTASSRTTSSRPWSGSTTPGSRPSASPSGCSGSRCSTSCSPTSRASASIAALMMANDRTSLFFGLILPHGLLELTAVFVAAAVGLRLFWSWVEPGPADPAAGLRGRGAHGRRHRDRAWWWCCSSAARSRASSPRPALPDLGPDRDRGGGRVDLPGLRVRRRPPGPPRRRHRRPRRRDSATVARRRSEQSPRPRPERRVRAGPAA